MRRRNFIAGTAATAAMSFAQPICAQIDGRSLGIKRIAFVHLTEKLDELAAEQFFDELPRSSPHFGLKRIKPVVEKIAGHIGRRLQTIRLRGKCSSWRGLQSDASTPDNSRLITPETTPHSIPTNPATAPPL